MKRTKMQKGITLIALIITIIILLILAVVTIGSMKNSNIITYAQNASTDYEKAKDDEQSIISNYESIIKENLPGGEKVTYIGDVPIPAGFKHVDGETIDDGIVIENKTEGSQFVWVPVPNIGEFASKYDDSNYQGVLYDFSGATATEKTDYGISTTSYREPANLTGRKKWDFATTVNGKPVEDETTYTYDGTDMFKLFDMGTYSENNYQDKFNKMVASVAKYGGFYVGRYETSLNENTKRAQSKAGQPVMNEIEWYRMYKYSETYSQSGVISEMIWGCQWDAMMRFIGGRATEIEHVSHMSSDFKVTPYQTGGTDYSTNYQKAEGEEGYVPYVDISNNIYDLEGNVLEWTQEANTTSDRVRRGGSYNLSHSPSYRFSFSPTLTSSYYGSRLALYIV